MSMSSQVAPAKRRWPWPEAAMEGLGLGLFMVAAGLFGTLLELPGSAVHAAIPHPFTRRVLMGLAMGLTAMGLVYSPWGRRSGAHLNPALTLTFLRLGRIGRRDAALYVVGQFLGGLAGALLVAALLGQAFVAPPVAGVATVPGAPGVAVAFACEALISFILVFVVLTLGRFPRVARFTGVFVGLLLVAYITFEAPFSGMSMNPARTLASAIPAQTWTALWIYFSAPLLGMLAAAEVHARLHARPAGCAKLHHATPCHFCGAAGSAP